MKAFYKRSLLAWAMVCSPMLLFGQTPIIIEAESGTIGTTSPTAFSTEWFSATATGGVTYLRNSVAANAGTANAGTGTRANGNIPDRAERVITYTVTFPAAGTYDFFARVNVRGGSANDSFLYGSSFGAKPIGTTNANTDTPNDWINVNNIGNSGGGGSAGVGHNCSSQVVDITATYLRTVANGNTAGTTINWKWIKISAITTTNLGPGVPTNYENGVFFTVPSAGMYTFQIAGRDAELWIDKLAFCRRDDGASPTPNPLYFTVNNLDTGTAGSTTPPAPPYTPPASQSPIATGKNKFLGCTYSGPQIPNFERYFNQVTPENDGKWGSVEGTRNTFNWTGLDAARNFARTNGFPFRMHVLVWGSQQPAWMKTLSDAEQVTEIRQWFQAVATRYPDLEFVEVVNEALNDPPNNDGSNATDNGSGNYLKALRSLNAELNTTPGTYDWIVNAFKLARQYFPCTTKLAINDYGIENNTALATSYLGIINQLKADNLIDVVGMQGHSFSTRKYDGSQSFANHTAFLRTNLEIIASTGVPIQITELDIDGNVGATDTERDANQLSEYQRIFDLYWNHPAVTGITLWGYLNGHWRSAQLAYLVDVCTTAEKPALRDYLNNTLNNTPGSIRASANPALGTNFLPSICGVPANLTVSCTSGIPAASTSVITVTPTNCPGTVSVSVSDVASPVTAQNRYTITRTWSATDACGNVRTASQLITVAEVASVSISASSTMLGCNTTTVSLSAVGTEALLWSTGETTPVVSITAGGLYSVTVTTPGGCSASAQATVLDSPCGSPVATLGQPFTLAAPTYNCVTGDIKFNTTGGDCTPITYSAIGITAPTTSCTARVDVQVAQDIRDQRPNVQPFMLMATQSGVTVQFSFDARAFCAGTTSPPAANSAPVAPSVGPQSATVGQGFSFVVPAFNDSNGDALTYSATGLPANGLSFNPGNRIISGTPSMTGTVNVTITATDPGNLSAQTSFGITISPAGSGPVTPPSGSFTLVQPTYNCTSGAIVFNTSGGDGTTITYTAVGVKREDSGNAGIVEAGLRGDPKPLNITATQSGVTVSYVFDFAAFCAGTTTPPTPGTVSPGSFTLTQPTYTCATGAIVFNTTGGDGTTITYTAVGIQRASATSNTGTVEAGLRGDPKPLNITATQSGVTVSYMFDFAAFCAGQSTRQGVEPASELQVTVLGNPTQSETVEIAIRGADGQPVQVQVRDLRGQLVSEKQIETTTTAGRQSVRLGASAGVYLLTVSTDRQTKTVKVVRQ